MAGSYGKITGLAAQCKKDDPVFIVEVDKKNLQYAKDALTRCKNKLPCRCQILTVKL